MALLPLAINPEPMRPPINAWLLDDDSPKYQVIKSQTIASISPAKIIYSKKFWLYIPFPTVVATAVPNTKDQQSLLLQPSPQLV
jgi:hypothetical protein